MLGGIKAGYILVADSPAVWGGGSESLLNKTSSKQAWILIKAHLRAPFYLQP